MGPPKKPAFLGKRRRNVRKADISHPTLLGRQAWPNFAFVKTDLGGWSYFFQRQKEIGAKRTLLRYGSPNWARTSDIMINSHALYRLSYGGI